MFDSTLRKNGQRVVHLGAAARAPSVGAGVASHASTAEPKPYQPGSISRHWPQLNTQGIARRSSMRVDAVRDAGRLPMLRLGDLGDRRRRAEVLDEPGRLVDERAVRRCSACADSASIAA